MRASGRPRVFLFDLWATVPYYTAYLARALASAGVDVEVGSITYYLDRDCFRSRGVRLRPGLLDLVGRMDLARGPRRVLKLIEGCINLLALWVRFLVRPPEIVHVQFLTLLRSRLPLDLQFIRFCRRRRGARLVLTVHDLLPHDTGARYLETYQRLYAEMDALICHSAHVRDHLVGGFGIAADRVAVISHGPFFYDLPANEPDATSGTPGVLPQAATVLWQGIIFPYKGVDLLLHAWRRVEAEVPNAILEVLGTGDPALLTTLTALAESLGLRRVRFNFHFCSAQELVSAYRAASVVVYPYRAITTSGALATGLALGKAIVASDLPVFREALTDGETALLVDAEDADQLARALAGLLQRPDERLRLEQNVQALHFGDESWRRIGDATRLVYEHVLTGGAVA